jgi:hypothetical protein
MDVGCLLDPLLPALLLEPERSASFVPNSLKGMAGVLAWRM